MRGVAETSVPQHQDYYHSSKGGFNSCGSCRIGAGDSRDSGTAGNSGDSNSGGDSRDSNSGGDVRDSNSGGDVRDSPLSFTKPFSPKPHEMSAKGVHQHRSGISLQSSCYLAPFTLTTHPHTITPPNHHVPYPEVLTAEKT